MFNKMVKSHPYPLLLSSLLLFILFSLPLPRLQINHDIESWFLPSHPVQAQLREERKSFSFDDQGSVLVTEKSDLSLSELNKMSSRLAAIPGIVKVDPPLLSLDKQAALFNYKIKKDQFSWEAMKKETEQSSLHHGGWIAFIEQQKENMLQDGLIFVPLSVLLMLLLLALALKSWSILPLLMANWMMSTFSAYGLLSFIASLMGMPLQLNSFSFLFPLVVSGLTLLAPLHLLWGWRQEEHLSSVLKNYFPPILLATLSLMIALISFLPSHVYALRIAGLLSLLMLFFSFLFTFTMVVPLFSLIRSRFNKNKINESSQQGWVTLVQAYVNWLLPKRKIVLFSFVLFSLLAGLLFFTNKSLREAGSVWGESEQLIAQHFSAVHGLNLIIDAEVEGGIAEPEYQKRIQQFMDWLQMHPFVYHSRHTLMSNELAKSGEALQVPLMLKSTISVDIINELNGIVQQAKDFMISVRPAGKIYWWHTLHQHILHNFVSSLLFTILAIFILLAVNYRDFRLGMLALLPHLLLLAIGGGLLTLYAYGTHQFSLGSAIVLAFCLGGAVSKNLYFINAMNNELLVILPTATEPLSINAMQDVLIRVLVHVARPMILSSLLLCLGLGVWSFGHSSMIVDFSLLSALIFFIALIIDLMVLPAFCLHYHKAFVKGQKGN